MEKTQNAFAGMLETLEAKASESIKANEGDYEVDGILYCGSCNTPKQTVVHLFGRTMKPFCLCKCAAEKRDQEKAEWERQQQRLRIESMRRDGFPDAEMQKWTFANDDNKNPKISQIAHKYVENFDVMRKKGKGLLLFGSVGTGKTFISACIANALIDQGYSCMVTNFARLTNTIQGMFDGKQDYLDRLNRFSLLVIDDLGSERDTEFMGEIVQNIIDGRSRAGLPLIITTNLSSEELKNPSDIRRQRIYSRLFELCVPVEVKGVDRRREKLKTEHDEFKELLGL